MKNSNLPKLLTGLLVVLAVFVMAFVLPAHEPQPHRVPLALVGPPRLAQTLEHERPDALDVKTYSSEADARRAIDHRDVYGALVVDRKGSRRLLIASAASATVAQIGALGLTLVALGERLRRRRGDRESDIPADRPADQTDLKEAA